MGGVFFCLHPARQEIFKNFLLSSRIFLKNKPEEIFFNPLWSSHNCRIFFNAWDLHYQFKKPSMILGELLSTKGDNSKLFLRISVWSLLIITKVGKNWTPKSRETSWDNKYKLSKLYSSPSIMEAASPGCSRPIGLLIAKKTISSRLWNLFLSFWKSGKPSKQAAQRECQKSSTKTFPSKFLKLMVSPL